MISFRNKSDVGASVAIIFAIVVLAVTLGAMLLPKPKVKANSATMLKTATQIKIDTKKNEDANKVALAEIAKWVYAGTPQQIAPTIFARVAAISQAHKLKLQSIRPQKTADADGLTQLPFQISVSGHFPEIAAMLRDLETPSERLSVNLLQISTGEGSTDEVLATIGAIAFLQPGPSVTSPASTTTTTTTTIIPKP